MPSAGPRPPPAHSSAPARSAPGWTIRPASATLEPVTAPAGARAAHLSPQTPARDHPHSSPPPPVSREPRAAKTHSLSRPNVLAELKSDPGPLGLDTLLAEIGKLSTVRALGLDGTVFGGASDRIVAAWRARAARMYPSDFADCPEPV